MHAAKTHASTAVAARSTTTPTASAVSALVALLASAVRPLASGATQVSLPAVCSGICQG